MSQASSLRYGDTFLLPSRPDIDSHLWIVCSHPGSDPDRVAIVNLTTSRAGLDATCQIESNEHPWVTHSTIVYYAMAKVVPIGTLYSLESDNKLFRQSPISTGLMRRIANGFARSPHTPPEVLGVLVTQELIESSDTEQAG